MAEIQQLSTADNNFRKQLDDLLAWNQVSDDAISETVNEIISDIRARGDAALLEYTSRLDNWQVTRASDLEIPRSRLEQAWQQTPEEQQRALMHAADRIQAYAEMQKADSWSFSEADGTVLGQQVTPLERVGLYVPGGKAAYPSSVLMKDRKSVA